MLKEAAGVRKIMLKAGKTDLRRGIVEKVFFTAFSALETTDFMALRTPSITPLMVFQMVVTTPLMALRTVETTWLIAFHTVWKKERSPSSSGRRKLTMPFQISATFVEIASKALPISIWIACQMVSNR